MFSGKYQTHLQEQEGSIKSPNYPDWYPKLSDCRWTIRVEPGFKIRLVFDRFDTDDRDLVHVGSIHMMCMITEWSFRTIRSVHRGSNRFPCQNGSQSDFFFKIWTFPAHTVFQFSDWIWEAFISLLQSILEIYEASRLDPSGRTGSNGKMENQWNKNQP